MISQLASKSSSFLCCQVLEELKNGQRYRNAREEILYTFPLNCIKMPQIFHCAPPPPQNEHLLHLLVGGGCVDTLIYKSAYASK